MRLTDGDMAWLRELLDSRAAISLDAARTHRAGLRLMTVAQQAGLPSVEALLARARTERSGPLVEQIIDAIATHETSWFRDSHPWETLATSLFPEAERRLGGRRPVRIWSAACSSGQEPYTIAVALTEAHGPSVGRRVEIIASDYSATMIERAREARYTQLEVNRGMPTPMMLRHFRRDGAYWRLADELRRMVAFEQRNLAQPLRGLPELDIVCIRNVMIYFEVDTRRRILDQVHSVIHPEGWLLLGASETLLGFDSSWTYDTVGNTMLYRPNKAAGGER